MAPSAGALPRPRHDAGVPSPLYIAPRTLSSAASGPPVSLFLVDLARDRAASAKGARARAPPPSQGDFLGSASLTRAMCEKGYIGALSLGEGNGKLEAPQTLRQRARACARADLSWARERPISNDIRDSLGHFDFRVAFPVRVHCLYGHATAVPPPPTFPSAGTPPYPTPPHSPSFEAHTRPI